MDLPEGYSVKGEYAGNGRLVCKLHKSLYGLKQASRQWNAKFSEAILKYGFQQSGSDHSLFTKKTNDENFIALLVYVDDILLGSTSIQESNEVKEFLDSLFKLKDLGTIKYFLGLEIAKSPESISICQRKYTLDLLEENGLLGAKPVLSQFMDKPGKEHLTAAHRVLKYLKGSSGQRILMKSKSTLKISGYADSDWAGCPDTRKSVTGFCIFIGDSLVSWKSKKQSVVARSSAEAEYRSMASVCCEMIWIKSLLKDFGVKHCEAMNLYSDSQSAIHISKNPVFHERTKHIEVDCHFIREKILTGLIKRRHTSTNLQIADILTKALQPNQFYRLLSKMNIHNVHPAGSATSSDSDKV
ncbi:Cysteine-rich RLK 8, putative [Theobroma cacao]|uniref:Cysteine-rich RLK 8, putative n=1 Tax=Theobroma cacao TaxID=3641 RepID=A0A061E9H3_THECC|nr:Cysteine-rich RLK 8, putative [Theobroma cacao]